MEELIYIAEPAKSYGQLTGLIAGLLLTAGIAYASEKKLIGANQTTRRQLVSLLAGLCFIILLATTFFTVWHLRTIQPIKLYSSYMESYHGKVNYQDIKRVGIHKDQGRSIVNPSLITREDEILVVELREQKTLLFSQDYYELRPLVEKIRKQIGTKK